MRRNIIKLIQLKIEKEEVSNQSISRLNNFEIVAGPILIKESSYIKYKQNFYQVKATGDTIINCASECKNKIICRELSLINFKTKKCFLYCPNFECKLEEDKKKIFKLLLNKNYYEYNWSER